MPAIKHILVPTDFGEPAAHAFHLAAELAAKHGATITLLHVWDVPPYPTASTPTTLEGVSRVEAVPDVGPAGVAPTVTSIQRRGIPWQEIVRTIEDVRPDLVVMGTHGGGTSRFGSVAEKVVKLSPASVLTVR